VGLTDGLRRFATARPHLLVVEGAASVRPRLAVERFAREQGWPLVDGPADADILVVAGRPEGPLAEYIDRLWEQLPGPRARSELLENDGVVRAMLGARRMLADLGQQRGDVRRTTHQDADMDVEPAEKPDPHAGHDMGGMDMEPAEKPDPHAHNDMGGMDMPAGLAMAERAPDRDGLKLDVLTVPWGPVLSWWPAGLVVTTVLQGDVVQEARVVQLVDVDANRAEWSEVLADLEPAVAAAVVRLDALVRLLAVAGWQGARLQSQQVRDALLSGTGTGTGTGDVAVQLHRLSRKVQRSRTLRQMTTGVKTTREEDVAARYRRWLDEALAAVDSGSMPATADEPHAVHLLPALLVGSDVAATRLVVASLELALSGADVRPVVSG